MTWSVMLHNGYCGLVVRPLVIVAQIEEDKRQRDIHQKTKQFKCTLV
jgi:hypothetical protein